MRQTWISIIAAVVSSVVWLHSSAAQWRLEVQTLPTPAAANSGQPQLTVSSRGALLSWIERAGNVATLKFAERTPSGWTPPKTAASGSDWFVNWADVPSVVRLSNGTLVAHWLQKSGADTYAYDLRLARSTDDGKSWTPSFVPHSDGTKTEHGFASLFEMPGSGAGSRLARWQGNDERPRRAW